jgi:cytochrome c556
MTRLEAAEAGVGARIASKAEFDRQIAALVHDAEMVAAIGEAIQQPDFEYHDDDTYRGYAAAMRDAALQLRAACDEKNYESARAAAGALKKSCDACHGDYRS